MFAGFGVTSFDSTSPFRQAFKDERDNYYLPTGPFTAVRVPQVEGNPRLKARIQAGEVDQALAFKLEERCLSLLRGFDAGRASLTHAVEALRRVRDSSGTESTIGRALYAESLEARPWRDCRVRHLRDSGIDVILFRGSERNKRRGFHNLHVFGQRLRRELVASGATSLREGEWMSEYDLRLQALEVRQTPNRTLYTFAVDGKLLSGFAAISRIHRDEAARVEGYQRPEVASHIKSIQRYLESEDPIIPNALVVAFDRRVRFEPSVPEIQDEYSRPGVSGHSDGRHSTGR